jgi:hypothetical protein
VASRRDLPYLMESHVRIGDVAVIKGTGGLVESIGLRTIVLRDSAYKDDFQTLPLSPRPARAAADDDAKQSGSATDRRG